MTLTRDGPAFPSLAGAPLFARDDSVEISKKETHGFFYKLLSRQHNMSKLMAAQLQDELTGMKCDEVGEFSDGDQKIMPCPYIRPLKNKLEPRVESAPLAPRRPVAGSTLSMACKKGELSRAARSCLSLNEADGETRTDIAFSDAMSLRSLRLREDIAAAAAADSSHLKEWGYYIKCYSEVSPALG